MQINTIQFAWVTNKGFRALEETFPIHPALNVERREHWVKAFEEGLLKYVKDNEEYLNKHLKAWRKHDKSVEVSLDVRFPSNMEIQKELQEYANKINR